MSTTIEMCPACGTSGALTVTRNGTGRVTCSCSNGCPQDDIYAGIARRDQHIQEQKDHRNGTAKLSAALTDSDAGGALAELLGLTTLDPPLTVTEAAVIGDGADAAAYMTLSDGSELRFRALREMAQPGRLMAEVVATTGAMPKLNQQTAMGCVALLKRYALHVRTISEIDEAIEWGVAYLQGALTVDVDVSDQAQRWSAFSRLAGVDPQRTHRETGQSIASASVVLRTPDGSRLVRTDWMRAYVRSVEPRVTPALLASLLQRVGWIRRGKQGRWKATRPDLPGQLNWSFWLVPDGWEDRGAGTAEEGSTAT